MRWSPIVIMMFLILISCESDHQNVVTSDNVQNIDSVVAEYRSQCINSEMTSLQRDECEDSKKNQKVAIKGKVIDVIDQHHIQVDTGVVTSDIFLKSPVAGNDLNKGDSIKASGELTSFGFFYPDVKNAKIE
jgi:hypothetical protein